MALTPWQRATGASGEAYDSKFKALERSGRSVHGEADFVASFRVSSVLDAGCGTGRVAIELARRGLDVCGVDREAEMLKVARAKAPLLDWQLADLCDVTISADNNPDQIRLFEAIVLAGNVMIFLDRGSEAQVIGNLVRHLHPGGLLIAGFQLRQGLDIEVYDSVAEHSGLHLKERWATWDRQPWNAASDYAVSVHHRAA